MYWEEVNQTCTFSTLKVWSSSVQGCLFCRKELTKFSANADGIKLLLCLWGFFPKLLFFSAESRKQWGHGGCLRTDLNINRLNSAFPLRNAFRVNQSVFPFFHLFATNIGSCTYLEAWNIESLSWKCVFVLAVLAATSTSSMSSLKRHCFQSLFWRVKTLVWSAPKTTFVFPNVKLLQKYYTTVSVLKCCLKHQVYFVNDDGK